MKRKLTGLLSHWIRHYRNSFFLQKISSILGVDILVRASGIILLPVYLWLMTQEEYGLYNYILSIVTSISVILNFGLYVSQSKYYSDTHIQERKKTVLFNIFFLLTLLLVIVIVPVFALKLDYQIFSFLFKTESNYLKYRWVMLLAILVSIYSTILANYFITSEKIKVFRKYNLYRLILINLIALVFLYVLNKDKIAVRLFYTYITELVILVIYLSAYIKEMLPKLDFKIMLNALKLGMPIMLGAIWGLVSNYGEKFFLEKYGDPKDLSYYYLAFSFSNLIYMICIAVHNAWMPMFLKEKDINKNIKTTKRLTLNLFVVLIVLSVLLMIGFYLALKTALISPKYWPAIYILPILLIAQIISGLLAIYQNYIIYLEKTHWGLFIGIFASLIGLFGSYFIIPIWNIYGAALVYLGVQITYFSIYYTMVSKKLKTLI